MTLTDSLSVLSRLIQLDPDNPDWPIHLTAVTEVRDGHPYDDSRYERVADKRRYASARREAAEKLRLNGP